MNKELINTSISHGTHRAQDLIPRFLGVLRTYSEDHYKEILTNMIEDGYKSEISEDDPYWESDSCNESIHSLFDSLNNEAPDNCYFGAHEGDGADFGFWKLPSNE
jgi:hypothetical protein